MKFIDRLERKLGKYYIKNLMLIIISGMILVYLLTFMTGDRSLIDNIILDREKVIQGEVWRLITFIFVPNMGGIISFLFSIYFYYISGVGLENEWGEFKFNLYYLLGIFTTIIFSMTTGVRATGTFINLSLFLAFARIYPNHRVLLFYILPIKIKYLAILNWIFIIVSLLQASSLGDMLITVVPILNFFIFFGRDIITGTKSSAINFNRQQKFKSQVKQREVLHVCEVCGITEKENPNMEFRYCSKCTGKKCYCEEHIKNHNHK